jgi:cytosine/adenosine deaminase-related metal-dependent hydrolase
MAGDFANMLTLHNVQVMGQGLRNIELKHGRISSLQPAAATSKKNKAGHLHFEHGVAFPGLINSHDHLHFNLFPRLGNRRYADYVEWGADIHTVNRKEIDAVLKIPAPLRAIWGLYKNLLNGVTTVVHHGESQRVAPGLIEIFDHCHSLHSVRQERRWRWRLNKPWARSWPFVIHAGEGTNPAAHQEIDSLIRWNRLKRPLVAIHGVAMDPMQAKGFTALVWCPAANDFLLKATADISRLESHTRILFGTDSTLTAGWNLWEQLRLARSQRLMSDEGLFAALTTTPSKVWGMAAKGRIKEGFQADIVIAREKNSPATLESWFEVNPADIVLVVQGGRVLLCDEEYEQQAREAGVFSGLFSQVRVGATIKYVKGDLPGLMDEIRGYHPTASFPIQSLVN